MADGEIIFKTYTVTGAAVALSGSTALNTTAIPRKLSIQNASGAADAAYVGPAAVGAAGANAGRELAAGEDTDLRGQDPADVYVIGTVDAANLLYITAQF